jgi:hypothetical protein
MTRKNFKLIAEMLRASRPVGQLDQFDVTRQYAIDRIAEEFADALAKTNPRFDHDKFLAACRAS